MILDTVATFLSELDVSTIHAAAHDIARTVAMSLTPALLIIAIYVRTLETSLDTFTGGQGRWTRALRDIMIWGTVLSGYFTIGALITNFANDIYKWAGEIGSLSTISKDMAEAVRQINAKSDGDGLLSVVANGALSWTFGLITAFFYYLSLLIVAFIGAFMRIAHAVVFGTAFIWGLIAIPISISQGFKLNRGWGLTMGFALLWPLMQALFVALLRPLFVTSLNAVLAQNVGSAFDLMGAQMLFTVLNLIFAASLVAAAYVSIHLVNNSSAAAAVVGPFVGAAIAGATATAAAGTAAGGRAVGALGGLPGVVKDAFAPAPPSTPRGAGVRTPPRPAVNSPSAPRSTSSLSNSADESSPASSAVAEPSPSEIEAKKKQQRRGVILNQQKKAKPT